MSWQLSHSARWMGWTLLYGVLLTLALGSLAHDLPGWVFLLSAVATVVLPLLIGMLFPEDNWRWGPFLAMVIAIGVLVVVPATDTAKQTGIGLVTRRDQFIFLLIWGGWWFFPALSLLFVGLAALGIRIGRNRLERQNWESDASFRNVFTPNHLSEPPGR